MTATCTHLDQITVLELPDRIEGCEECLASGGSWVHLRMCQSCGQIGCCDSSPNRHASQARRRERSRRSRARPSRGRSGAGATSTRSRSWSRRADAARAAPGRLAADEGHAAPVLPGGRQDPAGDDAAAQPLVERAALRRRPRAHDAPPASPRHDVRHHASTSSITRSSCARPTAAATASSCTTASTSRSSTGGCTALLGGLRRRRRHPRAAVRRADDDPVPVGSRARGVGPRVRRAVLGDARLDRPRAGGVQRLVQGQDEPGPPVLARPRPGRHPLLRARRPAASTPIRSRGRPTPAR